MSASGPSSLVSDLAVRCGGNWPTMAKAEASAREERAKRAAAFSAAGLIPADTSLVVFGSLARGEWTQASDLDWTLLVDGQVVGQHADIALKIAKIVLDDKKAPGPTG